MRDRLTFSDGVRFGLGFCVAQILFAIFLIIAFVFFGSVIAATLHNYSNSVGSGLNDAANEFGGGVIMVLSRLF